MLLLMVKGTSQDFVDNDGQLDQELPTCTLYLGHAYGMIIETRL